MKIALDSTRIMMIIIVNCDSSLIDGKNNNNNIKSNILASWWDDKDCISRARCHSKVHFINLFFFLTCFLFFFSNQRKCNFLVSFSLDSKACEWMEFFLQNFLYYIIQLSTKVRTFLNIPCQKTLFEFPATKMAEGGMPMIFAGKYLIT